MMRGAITGADNKCDKRLLQKNWDRGDGEMTGQRLFRDGRCRGVKLIETDKALTTSARQFSVIQNYIWPELLAAVKIILSAAQFSWLVCFGPPSRLL